MLKENIYHVNGQERPGSFREPRTRTYKTPAGLLFLQSSTTPALVGGLQADEGLRAFARLPEREHQLLLELASRPANRLTLAYTAEGKIVGQATLAPLDGQWRGIPNAYEVAIEVSSSWRNLGIAHQLLSLSLDFDTIEECLIVGLDLSWHWDYTKMGMSIFRYRALIAQLFAAHGFAEYLTSEPNIRMDPANILVARLGSQLPEERMNRFFERLFQVETWLG